jgi:hypothetical protein
MLDIEREQKKEKESLDRQRGREKANDMFSLSSLRRLFSCSLLSDWPPRDLSHAAAPTSSSSKTTRPSPPLSILPAKLVIVLETTVTADRFNLH